MKLKTFLPIRFLLVFSTFLLTVLLYVDRACISVANITIGNAVTAAVLGDQPFYSKN